jgi:hypothetical protein
MSNPYMERWEANRDEFHRVVGYSITAWAEVDDQLFRIFRSCVGPYDQCAIIYYRTPGLDARIALADEIVIATLLPDGTKPDRPDPRVKAWKAAIKGFRDLLAVRRRIAHHPVRTGRSPTGGYAFAPIEIHVGEHEALRDRAARLLPLQVEDLQKHQHAVEQLRDRLRSFFDDVLTKPPEAFPPPIPQCPPPNPLEKDRVVRRRRQRKSSPP